MSLRDSGRSGATFEIDEAVRRILAAWGQARDTDLGRLELRRAAARLGPHQKAQLVARLAEISLGLFYVLERQAEAETPREP